MQNKMDLSSSFYAINLLNCVCVRTRQIIYTHMEKLLGFENIFETVNRFTYTDLIVMQIRRVIFVLLYVLLLIVTILRINHI